MYTCRLMCAQHVHAKATPMPLLVNMGPGHGLLSGLVPRAAARCWGALLALGPFLLPSPPSPAWAWSWTQVALAMYPLMADSWGWEPEP